MRKFALNISNEEREKISLVLKVVTYFFVLVWDVAFIAAAVIFWNYFLYAYLKGFGLLGGFILSWYFITVVLIGAWVAAKGMKIIGNWEYPKRAEQPPKK
jgi:hypothetical protein